jgi:hypothetical protein
VTGEHARVPSRFFPQRLLAVACVAHAFAASAGEPHPEPRVIVNVVSVRGPHTPPAVQRAARLGWGRIVRCYKSIDPSIKGKLDLELHVSKTGSVASTRAGRSTLGNPELVRCLSETMKGLAMPEASADSNATIEIHVAPGDKTHP